MADSSIDPMASGGNHNTVAPDDEVRGLIGWFATNHVAANLLMFFIIALGIYGVFILKKETFPGITRDAITVSVPYLGAAPQEVEEGVLLKVEEAIEGIEGLGEIQSVATEGMGRVTVEVLEGFEMGDVMDEVKLAVDSIQSFPGETERPTISKFTFSRGAINLQVYGNLEESAMKELTDRIADEVMALPEVTSAQVMGTRPFEVSVEIDEVTLREYGLTLSQVSQAIRAWSVDIPGGSIRSDSGDIRLRAKGQAYTGEEFENIILMTRPDGTRLRLGDVATVRDAFAEVESYSFFDGQRSFGINVMATEDESEIEISDAVRRYVDARSATLPDGVKLEHWADGTFYLKGRMEMMLENMAIGAVLVFFVLGIFLHLKIAAWVLIGLPVAFLGAFMLMPVVGVSINVMSLFAFILVLGIVVDDAIIIAESAFTETEKYGYTVANVVRGAQRVAVPATFGVLTTIMAFMPLLMVGGMMQSINQSLGWVVVLCLAFSLVESKLILPAHLAALKSSHGEKKGVADKVDSLLKRFVGNVYTPFLRRAIEFRYATASFFLGLLIVTSGLVAGGVVPFVFFPEIDSDFVMANIELQEGAPESLIQEIVAQLDEGLREINEEIKQETGTDRDVIDHMYASISNGKTGRFQVELDKNEGRAATPKEIETRWRNRIGEIAGTKEMKFSSGMHMGGGPPIAFKMQGRNFEELEAASAELVAYLRSFDGVFEVESTAEAGPEEVQLKIKPEAEALGITLTDLASQVRQAFYGAEAQRIQRGDQEVRVMVRYPRDQRKSLGNLESMWIRLPDGRELPFHAVAEYDLEIGYNSIQRVDGRRTVSVTANVNNAVTQPMVVMGAITRDFFPQLAQKYPGVSKDLTGSSREERMSLGEMGYAFLAALGGIYALMAVPLRSYIQPLVIMSVIPFGIVGAVVGHMVVGIALNSISMIGIIALSGVVVNDSLIMVDFVNKRVAAGMGVMEAAIESGGARFRAIMLTSLTTFFGLIPIVMESSMQAQIVIPMAVSLAFGIVFATVITLVLIPCLYNIIQDWTPQRWSREVPVLAETTG
jgi:multidrug efflux pump subunit AcrB